MSPGADVLYNSIFRSMAFIAPFRAWRYDPSLAALSDVLTQPYDKITPEMQERYYAAIPYNLVRIILGKPQPGDGPADNVYSRAADTFKAWRRDGVLLQDAEQSIYHYQQRFVAPGAKVGVERRAFIALGKIEDYSSGIIFRHEQTLDKPKADRLDLLRATRAHFGQIFVLYGDPEGEIEKALAESGTLAGEFSDAYGVSHKLSSISRPELLSLVAGKMQDKKLIITDGHHRYETALNYRNERRAAEGKHSPEPLRPCDFVMMTFVNMDGPGLVILPTHRVVHGLNSFSPDTFKEQARAYFSVEEVDPSISAERAVALLQAAGVAGTAVLAITADRAFLIDTPRALGANLLQGLSLRQQSLDVVQLHKCLLEGVLGISEQAIREQRNVTYVRDASEALAKVRNGEASLAFLMNPVKINQVRNIAFAGEVLPQKSTDFYPKLLSGVTIYALE